MKKKLQIKYLKAENAELKEKLKEKESFIDSLLDQQEEAEKKIQYLSGEEHAYEVVHTGHIC